MKKKYMYVNNPVVVYLALVFSFLSHDLFTLDVLFKMILMPINHLPALNQLLLFLFSGWIYIIKVPLKLFFNFFRFR